MNLSLLPARELGWWLAPLAALVVVLGIEVDWGAHAIVPVAFAAPSPRPVDPALLPEYAIPGGVEARSETVNRTLFNPTRRPAPAVVQEAPKAQIQRGQFALTGTTVAEGKSTAFLRESKTGKFHRVHQGDTINGLRVTEVKPDRVRLTMGDESEELVLKVVANSKPTPGVPVNVAAAPGQPVVPGQPVPGQVVPFPGQGLAGQTPEQAAQTLLERRRAARAAAAAAAGSVDGSVPAGAMSVTPPPQGVPAAGATPPAPAQPQQGQATWNDMFRAYQQRSVR